MKQPREPEPWPGGYGTASEFGSLDGWALEEADRYLSNHPAFRRLAVTASNYRHYIFDDKSELWIRPDGQIIRIPHRMYNTDGSRIDGQRINIFTGAILPSEAWHDMPRSEHEWVVISGYESSQ